MAERNGRPPAFLMGPVPIPAPVSMLVSLVIPTYNRAALLDETLASVAAQTYPHWECIVVDDGSTDETAAVAARFAPRVRYVRQANAGPAAARNRGLEEAYGDAFMFLDSDDLLLPDALDHLVGALRRRPEAGIAYGGFYVMHANGRPGHLPGAPLFPFLEEEHAATAELGEAYGLAVDDDLLPDLLQHDVLVMGGTLLRRASLDALGTFDTSLDYMEHWEFFLRAARQGIPFVSTHVPVLRIRMHGGNLSRDFEGMLGVRLALIDRYLPRDHPNAAVIRVAARTNAQEVLGVCLCAIGSVEQGFRHLRQALVHQPIAMAAYDTITEKACQAALDAPSPERRLNTLLARIGDTPHARSLKHIVRSRFYRIWARRERAASTSARGAGAAWVCSAWHLVCALVLRPALGQRYAHRFREGLQKSLSR